MSVHSTLELAIDNEILDVLRKGGVKPNEVDIDRLVKDTIEYDEVAGGYVQKLNPVTFWIHLEDYYTQ